MKEQRENLRFTVYRIVLPVTVFNPRAIHKIKLQYRVNLVIETEATDVDGVSVEVVKLEDGVGGLLGLGISDQVKQD